VNRLFFLNSIFFFISLQSADFKHRIKLLIGSGAIMALGDVANYQLSQFDTFQYNDQRTTTWSEYSLKKISKAKIFFRQGLQRLVSFVSFHNKENFLYLLAGRKDSVVFMPDMSMANRLLSKNKKCTTPYEYLNQSLSNASLSILQSISLKYCAVVLEQYFPKEDLVNLSASIGMQKKVALLDFYFPISPHLLFLDWILKNKSQMIKDGIKLLSWCEFAEFFVSGWFGNYHCNNRLRQCNMVLNINFLAVGVLFFWMKNKQKNEVTPLPVQLKKRKKIMSASLQDFRNKENDVKKFTLKKEDFSLLELSDKAIAVVEQKMNYREEKKIAEKNFNQFLPEKKLKKIQQDLDCSKNQQSKKIDFTKTSVLRKKTLFINTLCNIGYFLFFHGILNICFYGYTRFMRK